MTEDDIPLPKTPALLHRYELQRWSNMVVHKDIWNEMPEYYKRHDLKRLARRLRQLSKTVDSNHGDSAQVQNLIIKAITIAANSTRLGPCFEALGQVKYALGKLDQAMSIVLVQAELTCALCRAESWLSKAGDREKFRNDTTRTLQSVRKSLLQLESSTERDLTLRNVLDVLVNNGNEEVGYPASKERVEVALRLATIHAEESEVALEALYEFTHYCQPHDFFLARTDVPKIASEALQLRPTELADTVIEILVSWVVARGGGARPSLLDSDFDLVTSILERASAPIRAWARSTAEASGHVQHQKRVVRNNSAYQPDAGRLLAQVDTYLDLMASISQWDRITNLIERLDLELIDQLTMLRVERTAGAFIIRERDPSSEGENKYTWAKSLAKVCSRYQQEFADRDEEIE